MSGLIRREDRARFWTLVERYESLPLDTRQRLGFEKFCEVQAELEEVRERTAAWALKERGER